MPYLEAIAKILASARKQSGFLLRFADSRGAMLLTLCDNVLAIIRACSQTEKACSRFLPIARCAGERSGSDRYSRVCRNHKRSPFPTPPTDGVFNARGEPHYTMIGRPTSKET